MKLGAKVKQLNENPNAQPKLPAEAPEPTSTGQPMMGGSIPATPEAQSSVGVDLDVPGTPGGPDINTGGTTSPQPVMVPNAAEAAQPAPAVDIGGGATTMQPAAKKVGVKAGGLVMRGATAHAAVQAEQAKAEIMGAGSGFRFWINVGEEARITFVDGYLDPDGALDLPYWWEHRLMIGGRMTNIVCYETQPAALGPCPVCERGHRTQLVAGLTIINHTPWVIQSGENQGKTIQNRRQMFVAPRTTADLLLKMAAKRGGLSGHCYDVYRKEKKDSRVGGHFDYVGQLSPDQIKAMGDEWKPFDWNEVLKVADAETMQKFGAAAVPYGGWKNQGPANQGGAAVAQGVASINI